MNCRLCPCQIPDIIEKPETYYCANDCGQCEPKDRIDRISVLFEECLAEGMAMTHDTLASHYAAAMTNWELGMDERDQLEAEIEALLAELELLKGQMN